MPLSCWTESRLNRTNLKKLSRADSETALERSYADMTMIVRPDKRQFQLLDFLFEFKYVDLKDNNLSSSKVKAMTDADLKTLVPVKQKSADAEAKLKGNRSLPPMFGITTRDGFPRYNLAHGGSM